jgi:hypothetical protein
MDGRGLDEAMPAAVESDPKSVRRSDGATPGSRCLKPAQADVPDTDVLSSGEVLRFVPPVDFDAWVSTPRGFARCSHGRFGHAVQISCPSSVGRSARREPTSYDRDGHHVAHQMTETVDSGCFCTEEMAGRGHGARSSVGERRFEGRFVVRRARPCAAPPLGTALKMLGDWSNTSRDIASEPVA